MVARNRSFIRPDDLRRGTPRTIRSQVTRAALLDAGARVVGQHGYAEASIARITEVAGIAQGTFYNYFDSRQELLDQILPNLSDEMLDFIRKRVAEIVDPIERERAQFQAFFAFLIERPEFFRVLHEAEQFAPEAYRLHHAKVEEGYLKWFKRLQAKGFLAQFRDAELKVVAQILMGARDYIAMLYSLSNGEKALPVPEHVVTGYMKLISGGLFSGKP
jgi:AcrR family transcriptional regulator